MKKIISLFLFCLFPIIGNTQALYKEIAEIKDSADYYLEIAIFNKEDKKSFNKAIIYTEKAIDFAKKNKLTSKMANSYLVLGGIYYDLQKNDNAIENFIRSINLYSKENPNSNLALAYYNLGKCYLEKDKPELSEIYFKKSSLIYKQLNFDDAIELINLQKAIIQKDKGNLFEAETILKNTIKKISNNDAFIETKVEAYFQLGEIENIKKRHSLAAAYFEQALKTNKSGNYNIALQKKTLKKLSNTYSILNDYKKSNEALEKYVVISDSIGNYYNHFLSENTFDKIQFDKQLKTIEELDREKKSQQKTLRFSRLISILSIALISILSLLSLSLYKNNKIRISTNKLLKEKNKELIAEKDKAEQASKARSEFLATVSHELRTPLNAINGITYLLLQEKPKASQLNYLKSLEFSGSYLLNFINDILEINRLESDKIFIEKINFDLHELTGNIQTSFNEFITENNVKLHCHIDKRINYNIIGDPTKLSQILINLLNNSIKFSKNGDVWFNIKELSNDGKLVKLFFEVKDNGIGIPKDKQDAIFDSFSQGSIEINRTYGGTGLGLSIVKKIIEILGSKIDLESDTNKGTSFKFELIFEKGESKYQKDESEIDIEDDNIFNNKNILLVEDNKINQMITHKMLEKKSMLCTIIENGEEAIEHLKDNHYDLILMDVHLPGINGTEATKKIREYNSTVPIIALTAISLNENKEMLLSFGMDDVITKPFIPSVFYKKIAEFLIKTEGNA